MISSTRNPKIQHLRALQNRSKRRRESGSFVVEGLRLADEAVRTNWPIRSAIYTEGLGTAGKELVENLVGQGVLLDEVSPEALAAASDTQHPQGVILELEMKSLDIPASPNFVLILDEISDPGNAGSLLRSAAAADVDAVIFSGGSVDAFSPKVLRSGMGAHFRIAIREFGWHEIEAFCEQHLLRVIASDVGTGRDYFDVDFQDPFALVLGSEAIGVSARVMARADELIHIPMPGNMESLNAAAAGSLLLFEAVRQRAEG